MATTIFCQRMLLIHHLSRSKRGLIRACSLHNQADVDAENLNDSDGASQPKDGTKLPYRLYYNPASYCHLFTLQNAFSQKENDEDERCLSTLTPCYWKQGNTSSVNSSRHLCSTKNPLLDLAFNESPETELPAPVRLLPFNLGQYVRAFHKCRPEYLCMSYNFTQLPSPTSFRKSWALFEILNINGSMKPSNVCRIIVELSCVDQGKTELVRKDQRFAMLLRYSVENLQLFSVCQLLEILQAFVRLDMPSTHRVLAFFELELSRRADQMTLHQLLFAADVWLCIGKQVPTFLKSLYTFVPSYVDEIHSPELVQLLYIIGEGRHCPTDLIQPIERLLRRHLPTLQPEEVGVACLGLFKSQTAISEVTVILIVNKACSFVENMSDFGLVNVMKFMRFHYVYHHGWLEAMGEEVPKRVHRMAVQGLMHVVLACSALHYRNDKILLAVAGRVPSLVSQCRSKDSCKLLWAFGTLGFLPAQRPNLYPNLTKGLRQRRAEFLQYPEHLLTGLLGLAFVSVFPEDLVGFALSPEFVNLALKATVKDLKKDLCTLDGAVEMELPDWTGPRLCSEVKKEVADMLWKFAKSDVCQKLEFVEAEACLKDLLGGEEFVRKRMILPYTRSIDIEVHLDSNGRPLPVMPQCNTTSDKLCTKYEAISRWGKINNAVTLTDNLVAQLVNTKNTSSSKTGPLSHYCVEPNEGEGLFDNALILTNELNEMSTKRRLRKKDNAPIKLAIQVCNRNQYCYHSDQLLGLHAMKRRHLKIAGYKVIELLHQEWFPLLRRSRREKRAYLQCKVFS